jgi:hypothetical protein
MRLLTMVGLIHSVKMSGSMYLPWMLEEGAKDMWLITAGYVVLGTFFLVVGLVHRSIGYEVPETEGEAASQA